MMPTFAPGHSAELFRELYRVLRADGKLVLEEAGVTQVRAACCALQACVA